MEGALRIASSVAKNKQSSRLSRPADGEAFRIVCIGESTTAWGGDKSYPSQLELILNRDKEDDLNYQVLNHGRSGVRSTDLANAFPQLIAEVQPHMVVVMTGVNDDAGWLFNSATLGQDARWYESWQIYRLLKAQQTHASLPAESRMPTLRLEESSHAFLSVQDRDPSSPEFRIWGKLRAHEVDDARTLAHTLLKRERDNEFALNALGRIHAMAQQDMEALQFFERAIRAHPESDWAYTEAGDVWINSALGGSHPHAFERSETFYRHAIELNPDNLWALSDLAYILIHQQKPEEAITLLKHAISIRNDYPLLHFRLAHALRMIRNPEEAGKSQARGRELQGKILNALTVENLTKIRDLASEEGASLIIMQYPTRSLAPLRHQFDPTHGLHLVSNETNFLHAIQALGSEVLFEDMFAGDFGHCTPRGNGLIASNLAPVVLNLARATIQDAASDSSR